MGTSSKLAKEMSRGISYPSQIVFFQFLHHTNFSSTICPLQVPDIDIMIASEALALRMKKVLPSIIHYDQTIYIKGRYVEDSVRLIDDLLKFTEEENPDGILFAEDIEN